MGITIIDTPRKVRHFLVYDFEWVPGSMQIRICGVYDGEDYRSYLSIDAFLDNELTSKNRGKWFYAHAGGLADIQFVFDKLISNPDYTVRASTSGSSVIIVHVRRGKNAWHFVDSYWLLRASLAKIATWIGRKKGSTVDPNFDKKTKEEKRDFYENISLRDLQIYNQEDCEILWHAISNFQGAILELGGQLQMTQASCAMHLFRRRFLSQDIPTSRQINEISKEAYIASRVEVFEKECEEAYYYDINSSFPYSMTKPCPGVMKKWTRRLPDHGIYMAHCRVALPDCYMPSLPLRTHNRIFFPVGRWESWFMSIDLELLQREGGRIEKVYNVVEFEPFEDLKAYAEEIYKIKKAADARGDSFEREVAKLLMNSLYGKFAEQSEKQMIHINPPAEYFDGPDPRLIRGEYLMPGVYQEERVIQVPHAHVPISAHITALSRRAIYDFMAPSISRGVHYCDTDGFSTGDSDIPTGAELGELKKEREIKRGFFVAPKVYRLDDKVKAKGFSLSRDATEAMEEFERLRRGEKIKIERMSRIRELYRNGISFPREMVIQKQLRFEKAIEKRFYYPDGTSRPWSIGELQRLL